MGKLEQFYMDGKNLCTSLYIKIFSVARNHSILHLKKIPYILHDEIIT